MKTTQRAIHIKMTLAIACLSALYPTVSYADCLQVPVSCVVTSAFGNRIDPVTKTYAKQHHDGVDFGCPQGTNVAAAAPGKVLYSRSSVSAGYWVAVVDSASNLTHKYMHNRNLLVAEGAAITKGQLVANSGNTGARTTGPHLHFQVEKSASPIDPQPLFCSTPPMKPGVLQGAPMGYDGDTGEAFRQATAPDSSGPAPKMGAEGSIDEIMGDLISSRSTNPDYVVQLATLSTTRLYGELAYLQSIDMKLMHERNKHKERINALQSMMLVLKAESQLRPQVDAQRSAPSVTQGK